MRHSQRSKISVVRAESVNLPFVVTFCTKRPYMLLNYIDVTDGLVNGIAASLLMYDMDIEVIIEVYAWASYVVEYANKADRGVSNLGRTIKALIEPDPSAQLSFENFMRQIGVNMLNANEM
ncbi:hypothetical protein MRX96_008983 [Rhipicephalus microplus]